MTAAAALAAAVVALVALVALGAEPAHACSCRARAPAEILAESDGAFVGVYTGRDDPPAGGEVLFSGRRVVNHFRVEQVLKGDIGATVDVVSVASGASCGLELEPGDVTGLFLRRDGGAWTSSLCEQVGALQLLAGGPAEEAGGARSWWGMAAATAVVLAAAGAAFGWRRRRV